MSAWPSDLPRPQLDGYQFAPVNAVIRTDMEAGPARQRQRFTAAPIMLSATWHFTAAQFASFRTFFDSTVHRGADWFSADLDTGSGLLTYDTRFTEAYQAKLLSGGLWEVTSKVELRNA